MPSTRSLTALVTVVFLTTLSLSPMKAASQQPAQRGAEDPYNACGMIYTEHYGPFDYRTERDKLKIVEDFHFTPRVEALRGGQSGWIGGDIDYTLHSSPNHHRALAALVKYTERRKSLKTEGMRYPIECYFDRAIRFAPNDTTVRAMYAQFLHKDKRTKEAMAQLDAALSFAGDNAVAHYNIGLVYFQLGDYERARQQAHRARELGLQEEGLENLLKRANQWK